MINVIESNVVGKHSPETCEDGLVVTDDFVAVIDGSTSKTPFQLSPSMKNGRLAMLLLSDYISQRMPRNSSVWDFCSAAEELFYREYKKASAAQQMASCPEMRLTASAIVYSKHRNEVWLVGDCQALVDGELYENGKPYETEIAQKRASLIRKGISPADARKAIEPLLIKAMLAGQNKTYAVLDGFPIYRQGVKVVSLSPDVSPSVSILHESSEALQKSSKPLHEIVLASDGYPFLRPTLVESEAALQRQLANDPQNIRSFIATKGLVAGNLSFDDRCYVRFTV